jgi:putative transposase
MIERCCEAFPVRMMCDRLGVSSSGYHEWLAQASNTRAQINERLLACIRALHMASDGVLGHCRIHEDLCDGGITVGVNRVGRLLRRVGLYGIPQHKQWRRKAVEPRPGHVSTHLGRDFMVDEPNTKWVTDITYSCTTDDWLHLCVVIDLHSRLGVGWSMSAVQGRQLVLQAILMALWQRREHKRLVLHSDRGCRFTSHEHQRFLKGHSLTCHTSAIGSCADNALAEGSFGILKRERVNRRRYKTRSEARADIFDYIEGFYNQGMQARLNRNKQAESRLNETVREIGS